MFAKFCFYTSIRILNYHLLFRNIAFHYSNKLFEILDNPKNVPCPLCNPLAIKKGESPKTCKDCSEAIFMLAKIKYQIDIANKNRQKIKELSNFKCNKEYNKIRQRVYENIKNGLKGDDFTKLYKKHIEPLIASYKGVVANENNFRDKEIKISKLENTVKTWKEANFTSES